jgi:lysozyme
MLLNKFYKLSFIVALLTTLCSCSQNVTSNNINDSDDQIISQTDNFTKKSSTTSATKASSLSKSLKPQVLLTGIDISSYNGKVDWQAVKDSGVAFVFVKATEGITWSDPKLNENIAGLKDIGIPAGYYHFYRPDDDPIKQADNFLAKFPQNQPLTLAPVIDIEVTDKVPDAKLVEDLNIYIKYLEQKTSRKPIIYSYLSFWNTHFHEKFSDYPMWIADYNPYLENPELPAGEFDWSFWQFTQKGKVPGINGAVDRSFFKGDLNKLLTYIEVKKPTNEK